MAGLTAILILLVIFGSITSWVYIALRYGGGSSKEVEALGRRVAELEAELAVQRRLLDDAILEHDELRFRELDSPRQQRVDA